MPIREIEDFKRNNPVYADIPDGILAQKLQQKFPERYPNLEKKVAQDVVNFQPFSQQELQQPTRRKVSKETEQEFIEQQGTMSGVKAVSPTLGFATGVAEAGTFGGADEMIGTAKWLKAKATGQPLGVAPREDYINRERAKLAGIREARPVSTFAGDVAGIGAGALATSAVAGGVAATKAGGTTLSLLKQAVNPKLFAAISKLAPNTADGFARGFLNNKSDKIQDRIKAGLVTAGLSTALTAGFNALQKTPIAKKAVGALVKQAGKVAQRAKKKIGISVGKVFGLEKVSNKKLARLNKINTQIGQKSIGKEGVVAEGGNIIDEFGGLKKQFKKEPEKFIDVIDEAQGKVRKEISGLYKGLDKKGVQGVDTKKVIDNLDELIKRDFKIISKKGKEVLVAKDPARKIFKNKLTTARDSLKNIKTDANGIAKFEDYHKSISGIGDNIWPEGIGGKPSKGAKFAIKAWREAKVALNDKIKTTDPAEFKRIIDLNRRNQTMQLLPDVVFKKSGEKLIKKPLLSTEVSKPTALLAIGGIATAGMLGGPVGAAKALVIGGAIVGAVKGGRQAAIKTSRGYNRALFALADNIGKKSRQDAVRLANKMIKDKNIEIPASFLVRGGGKVSDSSAKKAIARVAPRIRFANEMVDNALKIRTFNVAERLAVKKVLDGIVKDKNK